MGNESINGSIYAVMNDISSILGINSNILFAMMAVSTIILSFVFIYTRSRNMTISLGASNIIGIIFAVMGLIPLYTIAILVCGSLLIIWGYSSTGSDIIVYKETYRDRLIKAYEAKFGYSEPAFIEEIDSHIKAVENLGKGYTRAVHRDKLKRLEKFVEIKK